MISRRPRIKIRVFCSMYLINYPFDYQNCLITFESSALPFKRLILKWAEHPVYITEHFKVSHRLLRKLFNAKLFDQRPQIHFLFTPAFRLRYGEHFDRRRLFNLSGYGSLLRSACKVRDQTKVWPISARHLRAVRAVCDHLVGGFLVSESSAFRRLLYRFLNLFSYPIRPFEGSKYRPHQPA